MHNEILKVNSIEKKFGKITAVDNLSFAIEKGEIFALLGPNGAGKTTMVRMLMSIILPDRGEIEFMLKENVADVPLPSELGYLPEERGLYQEIPVLKTLAYMGVIRGMTKSDANDSAKIWLERFEISDRANDKLNTLSKGNQQKVQFIASIIHQPLFAIFDEPFAGFDPINQEFILDIVKELKGKGTTILLSAHHMQLVERIADKVLLINEGRKIAEGTIDQIKRESTSSEKIILAVKDAPDIARIENHSNIEKVIFKDRNILEIYFRKVESLSDILKYVASIAEIESIRTEEISLHEIFVQKVGEDIGIKADGDKHEKA